MSVLQLNVISASAFFHIARIPGKSNLLEVDFVHLHDVRVVQRPQRARIGASRLGEKGWEPRGPRSS